MTSIREAKKQCRQQVLQAIDPLTPTEIEAAERSVREQLQQLPEYQKAQNVMAYASHRHELPMNQILGDVLAHGKTLLLPRVDAKNHEILPCRVTCLNEDLAAGYYGIAEPAAHCTIDRQTIPDIVFIPGIAFSPNGDRLGRGAGFYDRFLAQLPTRPTTIGLIFEAQLIDTIPTEPHDIAIDIVITPRQIFRDP